MALKTETTKCGFLVNIKAFFDPRAFEISLPEKTLKMLFAKTLNFMTPKMRLKPKTTSGNALENGFLS